MKKIFAIALALVMVLSMASAFAAQCVTPNWACAEDVCALGKGKVEVIPYVKGNGCDGTGNVYTANTCAGAVYDDEVYFAVKVTVDANPNTEWWDDADLTFTLTGLKDLKLGGTAADLTVSTVYEMIKALDTKKQELKAGEYYLVLKGSSFAAVKAEDFTAKAANLFSATVTDSSKAKVCVALDAENDFTSATVNGYTVTKNAKPTILTITKGDKTVWVDLDKDDKIEMFSVKVGSADPVSVKTYNVAGTKFYTTANTELDWTCDEAGKFLKAVMDSFNLAFGTCITEKAIIANFGWDDEVKACFTWSGNVQAVVDAECVVAIPKTGDASVLAWLF